MNSVFVIVIVACCLSPLVSAQIPINGTCPDFTCCKDGIESLSAQNLSGLWYLYGSVPFFFKTDTKCSRLNITHLSDTFFYYQDFSVLISTNQTQNFSSFANISSNGMLVTLISDLRIPIKSEIIKITNDFFIEFACSDCGFFSKDAAGLYVFIYTRVPVPSVLIVKEIEALLLACSIPMKYIVYEAQTDCELNTTKC